MAEHTARRKKQFIDRHVQGALVFRLGLHWCAFLLIGMAVSVVLQYLADPFRPASEHFAMFVRNQAGFLLVMVCMTPVFLYDTVKFSNRFAGPVLRVRRTLNDLACGIKVAPVTFRPGDFWTDITDDLNYVVNRITAIDHEPVASTEDEDGDVEKTLHINQACS
jgi:hypothetical protein